MGKPTKKSPQELPTIFSDSVKKFEGRLIVGREKIPVKTVISTGSLKLDIALGHGGWPCGRICEIYGQESSGKTTLSLHAIAEAQKAGYRAAFIDLERSLDEDYAEALGIDLESLAIGLPDNGEEALTIIEHLISDAPKTNLKIIVIDSVANLVPKAEIDGDYGDSNMGIKARLMNQAMRKLSVPASKNDVLLIFLNQIRQKLGIVYGSDQTTTGGNGLKFYSTIRLKTAKDGKATKEGEIFTGAPTRIKVEKNKIAPPLREVEVFIEFGKGIDVRQEIFTLATDLGIITKGGAWYEYEGAKFQGFDNLVEALSDKQEELLVKIKAHYPEIYK